MDSSERTAVVTGANRGIGYEVARGLLGRGYRVIAVVRDDARARATRDALARAAPGAHVDAVTGLLDSVASTRALAGAIAERAPRIDVLVHNAGLWPSERRLTVDGFEEAYAVNHLAPFILNRVLEPTLLASRSRVVQVTAGLYVKGKPDVARTPRGDDFHTMWTYATTKAANLALVPLFAQRWAQTGVTIDAVHPGVIRTGLGDRGGALGFVLRLVKRAWKKPEEGARPVVRLATDPELVHGSGRFFDVERELPLVAPLDAPGLAERLWVDTCEQAGFDAAALPDDRRSPDRAAEAQAEAR